MARILIVDDDPAVREAYGSILSPPDDQPLLALGAALFGDPSEQMGQAGYREGYDLTHAENGEEAVLRVLEAMKEGRTFSVAFVDMKMPGIDGAETSRQIWSMDGRIKIVMVTAYSDYSPDHIVRIVGRDDIFYLRKPFNPSEIRQFARALANQWNLEREREDLSQQLQKANEELHDLNQNLHKRVAEQAALLIQSEKMASLGIMAAGVAHEINNPIAFVNSNLGAIQKYCTKLHGLLERYRQMEGLVLSDQKGALAALKQDIVEFRKREKTDFVLTDLMDLANESLEGTARVRDIARDLGAFSRMDKEERKRGNLHEILEFALQILKNQFKGKVNILKDYGEIAPLWCFPQQLSQAFMNLLLNAAQAIENQGTIRIQTRYVAAEKGVQGRRVRIAISDTGRGIPEKDFSRVFDPFYTTKPVGQGTGLGLSITYEIVKSHRGAVNLESQEGAGTTFLIHLPVDEGK